ncbi:high affinity cGMP-specific 3',5'-cyclic phosphodiesterase 9A-like isoform X3 [Carcharodon carcharias]|uniref:high affinity cGMP-specific 3',5'-cyclic phosphodiesterase 9A-like isoform X3 n=1 Tax=Carcharodon carcharias TaxID=13397 RepID=UPI001B7DA408|nr:high affinity cGMP-specific 3',5'-cyclic phosphodiesterase 9A-like isoform X3 [Carcharodon carcharias]
MGSASSAAQPKVIHLDVDGKIQKVIFSRLSGPSDVHEALSIAAGNLRGEVVSLVDHVGKPVVINPEMPANSVSFPYKVIAVTDQHTGHEKLLQNILVEVAQHLSRALGIDAFRSELSAKLDTLERRVDVGSQKAVEVRRCGEDIRKLREAVGQAEKSGHTCGCVSPGSNTKLLTARRDVPTYPKYTLSRETIDALKKPTFDVWQWAPNEMLSCIEYMYHDLGLVQEFHINAITLKRWLLCIQENYRDNPFHNLRHCFCVTQMMHGMIHLCNLKHKLSMLDIVVLITSAVCHDLDHPGYNNAYQINACTKLAIRYNNISPLENHHCAVAFQILSDPECNIFGNTDPELFNQIQEGITELILATDMDRHEEIMQEFTQCVDNFEYQNKDHLRSSEREKSEGLPVSSFMDRDRVTKPNVQVRFIKSVLLPMFETVSKLFSRLDEVMVQPLRESRDRYEELLRPAVAKSEGPQELSSRLSSASHSLQAEDVD